MKKAILCILALITIQYAIGQSKTEIPSFGDTTFIINEINTFEDTLWVMDSSHFYNSIDYELQFFGKYNVLSRDETGNKLTGVGMNNRYGPLENSYLDSIVYYNDTSDVHYSKTYSWSFDDYKWMDGSYQLFDSDQNLVEKYHKSWSIYQNEYINGSRTTYEFDNGFRTSIINYEYLPETNEWEPGEKQVNYYNVLGNDSIVLNQVWNVSNNQWENILVDKRYYNMHEMDSIRIELTWDSELEHWKNQYKNEPIYNDSLNYIGHYGSDWDEISQVWVNDVYAYINYAETGHRDTSIRYRWDKIIDEWKYEQKTVVSYTETGQILDYISMLFDYQTSMWMNDMKLTNLYYDNNVERIRYNGDSISNEWIPYHREFQSFIYENVSDTIQYDLWDTISQEWDFSHRSINVFDWRLNQTNSIFESWNSLDNSWQILQKTNYFWSPFNPLALAEINPLHKQIKIYPNPANSLFNIEVLSTDIPSDLLIEIFDINGKSVLKYNQVSSSKQFSIKHLEKGLYLVKIHSKGSCVSKKIIVQ